MSTLGQVGSTIAVIPEACQSLQGYHDLILSPLKTAYDILGYLGVQLGKSTTAFYDSIKEQKIFLGLPLGLTYLLGAKYNFNAVVEGTSRPVYHATKAIGDSCDAANAFCDFTEYLTSKNVVSLTERQAENLGVLSAGTLVGSGITGVLAHGADMVLANTRSRAAYMVDERKMENVRFNHSLMMLAKNVAYVALGVIALSSYFMSAIYAPWIPLACATSAVFITVSSYFYDRLSDYTPRVAT